MTSLELWIIVMGCSLGTFVWRLLGVVFGQRINPKGPLFEWVGCVSYAMVAGLIFRILIFPDNDLAMVPLMHRIIAIGAGFLVFFLFRRALLPGVVAGCITLMYLVY